MEIWASLPVFLRSLILKLRASQWNSPKFFAETKLRVAKMNLYLLPSGKEALEDAMFDDDAAELEGNRQQLRFWKTFRDACVKRGIEVHTFDFYSQQKRGNEDMLLVHVHPEKSFLRQLVD